MAWSRAIGEPFQGALRSTGLDDGYYQGLPIGGMGAGSIGRTWTGVTYALAAFLLDSGLEREAWQTARGPYRITYETGGMWFRTPEGWTDQPEPRPGEKAPAPGPLQFRASMYMRPLAIWAIQAVLDGKFRRSPGKK